jgi:hypothetical protein
LTMVRASLASVSVLPPMVIACPGMTVPPPSTTPATGSLGRGPRVVATEF